VFSRADTMENCILSFEEFKKYFHDEILSESELLHLFNTMDTNHNGQIEMSELVDYFSGAFDPYKNLFESLTSVNDELASVLADTAESYPTQARFEQFRTRVYLKECLRQIDSFRNSVFDSVQKMTGNRLAPSPSEQIRAEGYEGLKSSGVINVSSSQKSRDEISDLRSQVERLALIVDDLSGSGGVLKQAKQDVFDIDCPKEEAYIVVTREYTVVPEMVLHFRDATRIYIEHVKQAGGNLQIYVKQSGDSCFVVYEIWEDESYLAIHNQSVPFRQYQKDLVECLEIPTNVASMELPCSWWN